MVLVTKLDNLLYELVMYLCSVWRWVLFHLGESFSIPQGVIGHKHPSQLRAMATTKLYVVYYSLYRHVEIMAREVQRGANSVHGVEATIW
ncbi:hypothetical protein V6N11_008999 [Hibiscus sabdariffa]|uniref:Flavodoxin-like domain-containing protein n=1 Tax=Hibiscus sabdariffa TaxID=183260 RepID=A0ABR2PPE4_9ROSI